MQEGFKRTKIVLISAYIFPKSINYFLKKKELS